MIVGVNAFSDGDEAEVELLRIEPELEARQIERTQRVRAERDPRAAEAALARVRETARGSENLLPPMREALAAHCTVGEVCDTLRAELGTFDASAAP